METKSGWRVLVGGVLMAIGSVLPWLWIFSWYGLSRPSGFYRGLDGALALALGLLVVALGVWLLRVRPTWGVERQLLALLLLVIFAFVWFRNLGKILDYVANPGPYTGIGAVDVGIWVMAGGWAVAMVGILPVRRVSGIGVADND